MLDVTFRVLWRVAACATIVYGVNSYTHSLPLAFAAMAAAWLLMPAMEQ